MILNPKMMLGLLMLAIAGLASVIQRARYVQKKKRERENKNHVQDK